MKGCPYSKWSWEADCEICKITGKPTNGEIMCDFGYEKDCAEYKNRKAGKKD